MTAAEWHHFWASLSDDQKQQIRDKARWEHVSLWAAAEGWFAEWTPQRGEVEVGG